MTEQWFPAGGNASSTVLGRFIDAERIDKKASEEAGETKYRMHPILQSKIAGSHDISAQIVKPFNEKELKDRFPGAWEHYESLKTQPTPQPTPDVVVAVKGVPLHEADFLPRDKMPWLADLGFSSIEQLASMSDQTCQDLGRGALTWRKKAKEFIART